MALRKIIHIDMDAFYASVEQRDNPELRGRPVVVGGRPDQRGVVAAASYEVRQYGVRSSISCAKAQRLCSHAVFVAPRIERYREVSRQIHRIFRQVTVLIEPLSLDEAYLDVTENALGEPLACKVARWIRRKIRDELSLTASAGIGPSKLVAKIASNYNKPDGLKVVTPDAVEGFLAPLSVECLMGVGPVTAKRLHEQGIKTIDDLRGVDPSWLAKCFGKHGVALARLSYGLDDRPVQAYRKTKSQGSETTFAVDVLDMDHLKSVVEQFSDDLCASLVRLKTKARTITLKLRYNDFSTITRSRSLQHTTRLPAQVARVANALLCESTEAGRRPVRLIGVSTSGFVDDDQPEQRWLFANGFE